VTLDASQEVSANDSPGSGSGTLRLDTGTLELSWDISFADLEAPQTAAHFHGAARACETAGVQIGLPLGSPIQGSATLTQEQADDLMLGLWYVNVHSEEYPDGEIRGQVMPVPLEDPIPDPIPLGVIRIDLQVLASGLTAPNWGVSAPGDPSRLFVVDQNGILWAVDLGPGAGDKRVFLDVSARLVELGAFGEGTFDERGFLGIAFHPECQSNGLLYTFTSEPDTEEPDFSTMPEGVEPNCQSVIAEWTVPDPSDPNSVPDPDSRRELVRWDKPQFNHNGGAMTFGPDGMLYIAVGDGGLADDMDVGEDVGHGCIGNGQDLNTILGNILRIDPLGSNSNNGKYGIPPDNPFVGIDGLDEIYAYGFRNPWRMAFDPATGMLWCSVVGQNDVEEIDIVTAGANYGWRYKEGSFFFVFNGFEAGYVTDEPLDVPDGLVDPVAEYDHDEGTAIVGGFVYHGTAVPALADMYLAGDFARTFSNDGRLFYLDNADTTIKELELLRSDGLNLSLLGFGEDASGRVYVMANATGTPFGETGVVLRIGPARGDLNCDGDVNFDDIDAFVVALIDEQQYEQNYPDCFFLQGDINGDESVDFDDIDGFVECLINAGCP
jgi:glucose/arabinose dehydrogenase